MDLVLILENHNLFFPLIIYPAPEHTTAVEVKYYLSFPINELDADDASLAFASLTPAISS